MKGLNQLTAAAQPQAIVDRRKLPICAEPGCKRRVEYLPNGTPTMHCWRHETNAERLSHAKEWEAWRNEGAPA